MIMWHHMWWYDILHTRNKRNQSSNHIFSWSIQNEIVCNISNTCIQRNTQFIDENLIIILWRYYHYIGLYDYLSFLCQIRLVILVKLPNFIKRSGNKIHTHTLLYVHIHIQRAFVNLFVSHRGPQLFMIHSQKFNNATQHSLLVTFFL